MLQAVFAVILSTKVPSGESSLILFCSMTACTIVFHVMYLTRMVEWSQMEQALLTSSSSHTYIKPKQWIGNREKIMKHEKTNFYLKVASTVLGICWLLICLVIRGRLFVLQELQITMIVCCVGFSLESLSALAEKC